MRRNPEPMSAMIFLSTTVKAIKSKSRLKIRRTVSFTGYLRLFGSCCEHDDHVFLVWPAVYVISAAAKSKWIVATSAASNCGPESGDRVDSIFR